MAAGATRRKATHKRVLAKKEQEMARALVTTNLAWRVELVQPTPAIEAALLEAAKRPELAQKAIPLLVELKQRLGPSDPRLLTRLFYTGWGLKALEALVAEVRR